MNGTYFLLAVILALLVWIFWLFRKIKQVTQYTVRLAEGKNPGSWTEIAGVFSELARGVANLALRLGDEADSAKEQMDRIAAVLESMVEAVVVVDKSGKILLLNSTFAQFFRLDRDLARGRDYWEVIRDPDLNAMMEKSLKDYQAFTSEHTVLLTHTTFQIQISPVFGGSEFLGVAAVFHDVTKIKELERVRTEFVANVSHELKTPLTSIMGFVETLKEGAIHDPDHGLKFLEIIDEHSKKLHHLIEDLLLLSRVESGREELRKESIDFGKMLEKLKRSFEPILKRKNLTLTAKLAPQPFVIQADSKMFEHLLSNLLDNAIKYNVDLGQIIVKATYQGPEAVIEVEDTGIGLAEEHVPRIFERFYRVDKSRTRETGGTGLGLSIAKHVVERHSGKISVTSTPQKGSTFTITLPR